MKKYDSYRDSDIEWLGEIPSHWEVRKLKNVMRFGKGLTITKQDLSDEGIWCLNYGEIHSKYGFEFDPSVNSLKCVAYDYLLCNKDSLIEEGDFVFADTSEDIKGSGNFTFLNSNDKVFAGYHTIIGRKSEFFYSRFLAYELESVKFRGQIQSKVKGVKVYSITQSILRDLYVWSPPVKEQQAIATFLDDKCGQIDTAIAIKEKQIGLLKEQRQIIIHNAVTKGIDKNVKLRDSGVDWIGDIPEHWEVRRFKFLCTINTGSKNTEDKEDFGKYPFYVRSQIEERINSYSFDGEAILTAGDGAGVGKVYHYVNGKFDYHQRVYKFSDFNFVKGKYLYLYLLSEFYNVAILGTAKSTVDSLRLPLIQDFQIVFPIELNQQQQIVNYLEEQTTKIDKAVSIKEQQIEKLKEYKQSLINEVVTGKVRVS